MAIPEILLEDLPKEVQEALKNDREFVENVEENLEFFYSQGGQDDELSPPSKTTGFDNLDTYLLDPDLDLPELFILKKDDLRTFILDTLDKDEGLHTILRSDIFYNYFALDKVIQDFGYDLGVNNKSDLYGGSLASIFLPELTNKNVEKIESTNYIIFYQLF